MPVLEPNEFTLWGHVKAKAPWPQPNEDTLKTLAADWTTGGQEFAEAGSFSLSGLDLVWPDGAGKDFVTRSQADVDAAYRAAERMARISDRTARFADEVAGVKNQIRKLIETNEPLFRKNQSLPPGVAQAALESFVNEIGAEVNRLVAAAADRVAALSTYNPAMKEPPPPGASPKEFADYWRSLTEEQRLRLAKERPDLVGKNDGISARHRDIANRVLLDQERDRLTSRLANVNDTLAELERGGAYENGEHILALRAERDALTGKLNGIDKIQTRLNMSSNDPDGTRMYLLGISGADDGRAIVARGNPDNAEHVATYVPGIRTTLSSIDGNLESADRLHRSAIHGTDPAREQTSVITWLGYDTPNDLLSATDDDPARAASADLTRFQHGLRESHEGAPSHNTMVGHSYGSATIGYTAHDNDLRVDDIVAVGSPGLGDHTQNASQLRVDRVWVGENRYDVIADSNAHSARDAAGEPVDPSSPRFGAHRFRTDLDEPTGFRGSHGGYFDAGEWDRNPAMANMGDIINKRPPSRD
jgi:alpha/beta hydrolase family protein